MGKFFFHIDFNSYFATIEQQANPRLRGKPIGVTGGDRMERTVIGAASVEAKLRGVRGGMTLSDAKKVCPEIILVRGDSDKYLECTKRFLNILKDYSPVMEVFSIDEVFLEMSPSVILNGVKRSEESLTNVSNNVTETSSEILRSAQDDNNLDSRFLTLATIIKERIYKEIGDWVRISIGVSYNKMLSKLAGSLYKPDGLVGIMDQEAAIRILDQVELDAVCGIGFRIKRRLNNLGVFSFADLRKVPLESLLAAFKSYGQVLYNFARGIDETKLVPFYEKEEVKSVGQRHTLNYDTKDLLQIKQILLKLCELIGRRLRAKKLVGRTVVCYYRSSFNRDYFLQTGSKFFGEGMQVTMPYTSDGIKIFDFAWKVFLKIWDQQDLPAGRQVRMIGASVSNLQPKLPQNLTFLADELRQEIIIQTMDQINDRFGEFTLQRGVLLKSAKVYRKANPFLADRRFKL